MIPNPKGLTVGRREFESTSPSSTSTSDGVAASSPSSLYYYHADIVAEAPPGARERERAGERRVGGWLLGWPIRVGANAFAKELRRKKSPFDCIYTEIPLSCRAGAIIVGVDERCPNHGMRIGDHILTVQVRANTHNYSHVARHISDHVCPVTAQQHDPSPRSITMKQGHPEFAPCAPAGHRALKAILVEKGMQGMEWGEKQATDSLLWARRFLRHVLG